MNKLYLLSGCLCIAASATAMPPATVQGRPYPRVARTGVFNPDAITASEDFNIDSVQFWAGEGENRCAVVIQWELPQEENALVFGYRWDGDAYGADALKAIVEKYPGLYAVFENGQYGLTVGGLGWDFNSDGVFTLTSTAGQVYTPDADGIFNLPVEKCDDLHATDSDDWFSGGWYDGYWSYWVRDADSGSMDYALVGASSRQLTDGCVDGWMFAPGLQSGEWKDWLCAPEPSSLIGTDMFEVGNVYYQIITSEGTPSVRIVAPWQSSQTPYGSDVIIPAAVEHGGVTYTVTEVGEGAFMDSGVVSVTLPPSVERLGAQAFATVSLTEIVAQGMVPPVCESNTFSGTVRVIVPAAAKEAYGSADVWKEMDIVSAAIGTIFTDSESGVRFRIIADDEVEVTYYTGTSSNPNDYYYNSDFYREDVTVPSAVVFDGAEYAVRSVGKNAFRTARNLTSVSLPESIATIGTGAFADTKALAAVNIPSLVTEIPEDAFYQATGLRTLTGAENVETVGKASFLGCEELETVEGLTKVKTLGDFCFATCSRLERLPVMPALKTIGDGALTECQALKDIVLPSGVESIGEIFSCITNGDVLVYSCMENAPDLKSIYTFCVRYFNDDDQVEPIYAPVYVPYGHTSSYRKDNIWRSSEIRELTPVVFILRDNMDMSDDDKPVFSAVLDCDYEVVEENVPDLFLEANDFSTAAADYAEKVYLQYRRQDLSGIWNVTPEISGTGLKVTLRDIAPGKYEYRWTSDDEAQPDLTTDWVAFEVAESGDDPYHAFFDFSNAETLDPAPGESDWVKQNASTLEWKVAGIPFTDNGVTVSVADGVKAGFLSAVKKSLNSITTYNGLNMYGPLSITAPEGYVIEEVKVDNDVRYSSWISSFKPDESYLGYYELNNSEQPYSVTWTADEGMDYPHVEFNTKLNTVLQSYGNVTIARMWVTLRDRNLQSGIEAETADQTEAVYYTLQGVRVDNPGPGIYIERRGTVVRKVMIK